MTTVHEPHLDQLMDRAWDIDQAAAAILLRDLAPGGSDHQAATA